jgi:hypothetical protein
VSLKRGRAADTVGHPNTPPVEHNQPCERRQSPRDLAVMLEEEIDGVIRLTLASFTTTFAAMRGHERDWQELKDKYSAARNAAGELWKAVATS